MARGYHADPNDGTPDRRLIYDLWHEWNFCGCGAPEDVMEAVCDRLAMKRDYFDTPYAERPDLPEGFFANSLLPLIMDYLLDAADLTEHGGNISGAWLTDKGREVLRALEENDIGTLMDGWDQIGLVPD